MVPRFYIGTLNHVGICNLKVDMKLSKEISVNKWEGDIFDAQKILV